MDCFRIISRCGITIKFSSEFIGRLLYFKFDFINISIFVDWMLNTNILSNKSRTFKMFVIMKILIKLIELNDELQLNVKLLVIYFIIALSVIVDSISF